MLMYGVNASIVSKLQRVQNTAAKLVTRKKKYEHITPTLVALHWLPFKFRCQYKLLLYAFKALQEAKTFSLSSHLSKGFSEEHLVEKYSVAYS
jgi:hypothetical protein